ncbi:hypothetical protein IWW38_004078, partial [Coemansia aciculifera]
MDDNNMYNDKADKQDAAWAESELRAKGNMMSDRVLSCPQCLVQICFVCQLHAQFAGQWYHALLELHCM